jgi:hypothetical protein
MLFVVICVLQRLIMTLGNFQCCANEYNNYTDTGGVNQLATVVEMMEMMEMMDKLADMVDKLE